MFRGREMAHPERGEMILNRLAEDLGELATIEQRPQQDGRNMTMMLAPARSAEEDGQVAAPVEEEEADSPAKRRQPQQKPAGSGQPADINPQQI
jgi:translation initiation factor IF-3